MKRFLWFLLGMVLATALLVNYGCVTTGSDPLGIMTELDKELEEILPAPIQERGWYPLGDDGYTWVLQGTDGTMVAKCEYRFIRHQDQELWKGTFYHRTTDFFSNPYFTTEEQKSLAACVKWAEGMSLGGYYSDGTRRYRHNMAGIREHMEVRAGVCPTSDPTVFRVAI
jgi:hypothetical protein